jgi:hypothetical protein
MAVFMFWNLGGSNAIDQVASLCRTHGVDVLALAEAPIPSGSLIRRLNQGISIYRELMPEFAQRVRIFSRYPDGALRPVFDDGHAAIRNLTPPLGMQVLVVAVHMPSKLWASERDQYYRIRELRSRIMEAEAAVGHQNTLVIGDLNANPFEESIAAADALHGVMDKQLALRTPRTVQGQAWDFFYNPMWSRLGDESPGPPGTYFHSGSGTLSLFWHSFDQVLLRPSLLPYYDIHKLSVITDIDGTAIIDRNGSRPHGGSDHLPIVLTLSIEEERLND